MCTGCVIKAHDESSLHGGTMEWGGFDLHPDLACSESVTNNAFLQVGSLLGLAMMGAMFQGFDHGTYISDLAEAGLSSNQIDKSVQILRQMA